jgi:hypothetical protein
MPSLNSSKLRAVKALVETAPDDAIVGLSKALAKTLPAGPLAPVRDMVRAEVDDRKVRNTVLAPVVGLCRPGRRVGKMTFSSRVMRRMWSALKSDSPELVAEAAAAMRSLDPDEHDVAVLDALCAVAGQGLRNRSREAFAEAAQACDAAMPAGAETMAGCLDLAPVVRAAMPQVEGWVGRMTEERMISARLALKDAVSIAPDAGPKFIEMLASGLEEPWLSLRLVSAIMDRPTEFYMASSEMSGFADDVFDDIDNLIAAVRNLDPDKGVAAARAAGACAHQALLAMGDFENSIELSRDGPWGARLAHQKTALIKAAESKLLVIDAIVGAALPLEDIRFAGRMTKTVPKLTADPDPIAVGRAEAMLAFAHELRTAANFGGFGTARTRALSEVNERLTAYTDDLLGHLRSDDLDNMERARRYLEVAAGFLELSADERAAQIVRRRAAA